MRLEKVLLKDICELLNRGVSPKYSDDGNLIINQKCIRNNIVSLKEARYSSLTKKISSEKFIKPLDILVNSTGTGTLGRTAQVKEVNQPMSVDTHVTIVRPNDTVDKRFIGFQLALKEPEIVSLGKGATNQQELGRTELGGIEILLPPLPTQRRIGSILSAYDDLIENNLKRIKLLEEIAQRTYEEWFVKFRVNGRQLIIDEKTGLPIGWNLKPFEELIDFKEGPGLRNTQYREEGIPFLNIRVIKDDEVDFSKIQYLDPTEVQSKYPHFLLHEFDHVISTSGTLGRLVTIRKRHLPLCLNTSLIRMREINDNYGKWLIKHTLSNKKFIDIMEAFANGSAQKNFGPIH
jgi:type I restriction enzyme S subunit